MARRLFDEAKAKGVDLSNAHVVMAAGVPGANYVKIRSSSVIEAMGECGITSYEIIDAGGLEMTTVEARITSHLLARLETTFLVGLEASTPTG